MLSVRRDPTFSSLDRHGPPRTDGVRLSAGRTDHVHAGKISLLRGLPTLEGNVYSFVLLAAISLRVFSLKFLDHPPFSEFFNLFFITFPFLSMCSALCQ